MPVYPYSTPRRVATTVTADATLAKGRHTPVDAGSGPRTMTLPTDAVAGVEVSVEKVDATTNAVTITGTLRGVAASTIKLATQYEARTYLSEGSGSWRPISDHRTAAGLSATYSPLTKTPRLHVLGDSLSQNGLNLGAPAGALAVSDPKNPWAWAMVLSQAKLRIGTIGATGGYNTSQIRATHLPTVLAAIKPGDMVAVLAGTNDSGLTGGIGGSDTIANMTAMYDAIVAAGGTPVCCTIPPVSNEVVATAGKRIKHNIWIERTARARGFLFLDFYKVLVDPATNNYATGLANDTTHPNGAGARAMGQLAADTLVPKNAPEPFLASFNLGTGANPPDGVLKFGNACMLTDSNGDGVADQFVFAFGTKTGGSGFSLVTVPGVVGKMQKVTRGATGPDDLNAITDYVVTGVPGHVYYVAFKFKFERATPDPVITDSIKGVFQVAASGGTPLAGITENGWEFSTGGVLTWASEFTFPNLTEQILIRVGPRGGECSAYMGQLTLIDLTAQGLS